MNINLSEPATELKRAASIKSLRNGRAGPRNCVRSLRAHTAPGERLRSRGLLRTNHHPPGEEKLALISPPIGPLQLRDAPPPPGAHSRRLDLITSWPRCPLIKLEEHFSP